MINIFFILDLSHIRSPIISDKEKILEFCQNTFSWGDYIDEVYDFWINEGNSFGITAAGGAGWQLGEWIVDG